MRAVGPWVWGANDTGHAAFERHYRSMANG
jgi:hypothetical protein